MMLVKPQIPSEKYDIVFSINVHEKYDFLLKQLNNIQKYVKCNYCIVLNCLIILLNEKCLRTYYLSYFIEIFNHLYIHSHMM